MTKIVALVERSWLGVTPAGGAERMIHSLMSYLANHGWEAVGIIPHGSPLDKTIDGVRVVYPTDKHQLHNLFKDADVAITHLGGTPQARGLARTYNIPLMQLIHNTSEYSVGFLGDGCDLAIYNSEWVKDYHDRHSKSPVVQSWLNPKCAAIRKRLCYEWPDIIVHPPILDDKPGSGAGQDGYISLLNLTPNKGPDVFYELAERNPALSFMAVIGGYEPDKQHIRQLPNVRIREHTSDIDAIYSETSIVLMPSIYESYGLVAVEAIGRGIPCIVSDTPGLRESMGEHGIFCEREQIDQWQRALESVFSNYDRLSKQARARYAELYSASQDELKAFELTVRGLIEGWHY